MQCNTSFPNYNLQKGYGITTTSSLTSLIDPPHLHINNHVKQLINDHVNYSKWAKIIYNQKS